MFENTPSKSSFHVLAFTVTKLVKLRNLQKIFVSRWIQNQNPWTRKDDVPLWVNYQILNYHICNKNEFVFLDQRGMPKL